MPIIQREYQITPPPSVMIRRGHWSTRGLVGLWDAREGAGETAFNRAGLDSDGTLQSGVTQSSNAFGRGYQFADSYIDIGTQAAVRISGAFTIIAWGTHEAEISNYRPYFSCWNYSGSEGYGLSVSDTNKLRLDCYGSGTTNKTGTTNIGTGFRMVAGTVRADRSTQIWVDGASEGTTTMDAFASVSSSNAIVGGDYSSIGTRNWTGMINRVMLFNRGFSTSEIVALYRNPNLIYQPRRLYIPPTIESGGTNAGPPIYGPFAGPFRKLFRK